ncbi:hypothetical protein FQZ97_884370 [compost metagenome]
MHFFERAVQHRRHSIDKLAISHAVTEMSVVYPAGLTIHIFGTTSHRTVANSDLYLLCSVDHRLQTTAAQAIHRDSGSHL